MRRKTLAVGALIALIALSGCLGYLPWGGDNGTPEPDTDPAVENFPDDPNEARDMVEDSRSSPPDADERRESGSGSPLVEVSPGVAMVEGMGYQYTVTPADGEEYGLDVFVQDVMQPANAAFFKFTTVHSPEDDEEEPTVNTYTTGWKNGQYMEGVENSEVAIAAQHILTVSSLDPSEFSSDAPVGRTITSTTPDGKSVTAEVVDGDSYGGVGCLVIEVEVDGTLEETMCYAPAEELVLMVERHGDAEPVDRIEYTGSR